MVAAAVMGVATLGGAALASSASNRASRRAADTAAQTQQANLALARENRDMIRGYVDPLTPYAYSGASALAQRAGLAPPNVFRRNVNENAPPPTQSRNLFATGLGAAGAAAGGAADPLSNARPNPYASDNFGATYGGKTPEPGKPKTPGGMAGTFPANDGRDPYGPSLTYYDQGDGRDWAQYVADNQDVAEWARQKVAAGEYASMEEAGADHYRRSGESEGRAVPTAPTNYQPPVAYGTEGFDQAAPTFGPRADATRPDAGPAPNMQRPDAAPPPEFTRPTMARPDQPTFNDPGNFREFSFDASKIAEDPGYQFRLNEGMRSLNTGFGARGLLRSGGAMKGVLDYSQGLASQEVANAFARQMAAYQANAGTHNTNRTTGYNIFATDRNNLNQNFESDRSNLNSSFESDRGFGEDRRRYDTNRTDQNFNSDRGFAEDRYRYGANRTDRNFDLDVTRADARYDADRAYGRGTYAEDRDFWARRFDRQTADITDLTRIGTGAINTLGGVGTNYVTQATGANNAAGSATANAALVQGANAANIFGTAAQGLGAIYGAYSGGNPFGSSAPASTAGTVNYGGSLNNVFNRPPVVF